MSTQLFFDGVAACQRIGRLERVEAVNYGLDVRPFAQQGVQQADRRWSAAGETARHWLRESDRAALVHL